MRETDVEDHEPPFDSCMEVADRRHRFIAELVTETAMLWMNPSKARKTIVGKRPVKEDIPRPGQDEAKDCLQVQLHEVNAHPVVGPSLSAYTEADPGGSILELSVQECSQAKQVQGGIGLEHTESEAAASSGGGEDLSPDEIRAEQE